MQQSVRSSYPYNSWHLVRLNKRSEICARRLLPPKIRSGRRRSVRSCERHCKNTCARREPWLPKRFVELSDPQVRIGMGSEPPKQKPEHKQRRSTGGSAERSPSWSRAGVRDMRSFDCVRLTPHLRSQCIWSSHPQAASPRPLRQRILFVVVPGSRGMDGYVFHCIEGPC
jgi:hypothetical protein